MRMNERGRREGGRGLIAPLGRLLLGEVRASRTKETDCMHVCSVSGMWVSKRGHVLLREDEKERKQKGRDTVPPRLRFACMYVCHELFRPSSISDTGIKVEFERKTLNELAVAWIRRMQAGAVIPTPLIVIMKDCWSRKGDNRMAAAVPHTLRKASASAQNNQPSGLAKKKKTFNTYEGW